MMLRALYDLARREGLLDEPDFEERPVDYLVRIDDRGRFLALVPTADEEGRATQMAVPRLPKRAGTRPWPGFFYDNAKYALGIAPGAKRDARARQCAGAFREEVRACAEATSDDGALALVRFLDRLESETPKLLAKRPAKEWTGSEWIAFVRDADGTKPIHARPKVRAHLRRKRSNEGGEERLVRCLVTGDLAPAALTHPNVKRVPQAQTSGAALVSFNCDAFESQGLSQGQNASVSRAASEGYVTALNWLLSGTQDRIHRHGVRLGDDEVTIFWTRDENDAADILGRLLDPGPRDAMAMAESPLRGFAPAHADDTPFYAVTLSGNAARVVVRDWFETTAAEVKRNVLRYFEDLHIGSGSVRPLTMWKLLGALEAPGGRGLAPGAKGTLLRAALRGDGFPTEMLSAALRRLRVPPRREETPAAQRELLHARCAIVKAVLRRSRSGSTTQEVTVSLDETKREVPYLLGRLFAVLERLQAAAQGDVNATIRDRWFGAASATPALAFPRLLQLSVHHAAKAERGAWLEKLKGEIVGALPPETFPRMLRLEQQGLFAIGYYHQRERFFEKRAPNAEGSESDA